MNDETFASLITDLAMTMRSALAAGKINLRVDPSSRELYLWTDTHWSKGSNYEWRTFFSSHFPLYAEIPWREVLVNLLTKGKLFWPAQATPYHLLNCKNGVVNMKTGEMSPHDPLYYFDYVIDQDYDPLEALGNASDWADCITPFPLHLQILMGYCLSSSQEEGITPVAYVNNISSSFFSWGSYSRKSWDLTSRWPTELKDYPIPFNKADWLPSPSGFLSWCIQGYRLYVDRGSRLLPRLRESDLDSVTKK